MVSLNYRTYQICPSLRCLSRMWLQLLPVPRAAPSRGAWSTFQDERDCNKVFFSEKC